MNKGKFMQSEISLIADKMKEYFNEDQKRINHALKVSEYAEKILKKVPADRAIVLAASYLHDIGIHEAERKHNSTAGYYQQIEGPPIAKKILEELGYGKEFADRVCAIIAKHHTINGLDTNEFQVLYEADWIVNLHEDFKEYSLENKKKIIEKNFKTDIGKNIAYKTCI